MLCGTDNILQNIPQIHIECEEYYVEYHQSENIPHMHTKCEKYSA